MLRATQLFMRMAFNLLGAVNNPNGTRPRSFPWKNEAGPQREIHVVWEPGRLGIMETGTILIADPDLALLKNFSFFISSDLPGINLTACTSVQQTAERLFRSKYSTVIVAFDLIQEESSVILHRKRTRHALVPLILTIGPMDCKPAHDALLHRGAFDVIAKPVDPTEALASIRISLWQAQFLGLLTQRERIVSQFERHLAAYPDEQHGEGAVGWISKRVDDALMLVRESRHVIDLHRLDALLIDLAGSVEEWSLERALDRLERIRVGRVWT